MAEAPSGWGAHLGHGECRFYSWGCHCPAEAAWAMLCCCTWSDLPCPYNRNKDPWLLLQCTLRTSVEIHLCALLAERKCRNLPLSVIFLLGPGFQSEALTWISEKTADLPRNTGKISLTSLCLNSHCTNTKDNCLLWRVWKLRNTEEQRPWSEGRVFSAMHFSHPGRKIGHILLKSTGSFFWNIWSYTPIYNFKDFPRNSLGTFPVNIFSSPCFVF